VRDTTCWPTDNQFYRDRYGIVVGNFPDVIRLGEGRDVADVPHPLSPFGLTAYDFVARDTLGIRLGQGPAGARRRGAGAPARPVAAAPRRLAVRRLETARLVRLAFTFTRAAYLDPRNEDVSIVLENALVEGRFWLPRRQEVEVRRAAPSSTSRRAASSAAAGTSASTPSTRPADTALRRAVLLGPGSSSPRPRRCAATRSRGASSTPSRPTSSSRRRRTWPACARRRRRSCSRARSPAPAAPRWRRAR
jgi:hypothetical protein